MVTNLIDMWSKVMSLSVSDLNPKILNSGFGTTIAPDDDKSGWDLGTKLTGRGRKKIRTAIKSKKFYLFLAIPTPYMIDRYEMRLEEVMITGNVAFYTRILGLDIYHKNSTIYRGRRLIDGIGLGSLNYSHKLRTPYTVSDGVSIGLECEAKIRDGSPIPRGISSEKTSINSVGARFSKGRPVFISPGRRTL